MKVFPELEIPNAICRFENYTQSFEWLQILIWFLALWGLSHLVMVFYSYFRCGGDSK